MTTHRYREMLVFSLRFFLLVLSFSGVAYSTEFSGSSIEFQGKAFSLDNDEHLYTEYHEIKLDAQGRYVTGIVRYERPDGVNIALKTLDFEQDQLLPDLNFVDRRTGHVTDVVKTDISVVIQQRSAEDLEQSEIRLEQGRLHVTDAGFDRLVVKHWQKLIKGERVSFDVVALSRRVLVGFMIELESLSDQQMALSVKPKNWFMRLLVEPISLVYDTELKRLQRYEGITNIAEEASGNILESHYQARIEYLYPRVQE